MKAVISCGYEPSLDNEPKENSQIVDNQIWIPTFGEDSLQRVIDRVKFFERELWELHAGMQCQYDEFGNHYGSCYKCRLGEKLDELFKV